MILEGLALIWPCRVAARRSLRLLQLQEGVVGVYIRNRMTSLRAEWSQRIDNPIHSCQHSMPTALISGAMHVHGCCVCRTMNGTAAFATTRGMLAVRLMHAEIFEHVQMACLIPLIWRSSGLLLLIACQATRLVPEICFQNLAP